MSDRATDNGRSGRMRSRAVKLTRALLDSGEITVDDLSARLVVSASALETFVDGSEPMPFDRQVCLALLAIDKFPVHARAGYRLRDQLRAKALYDSGETVRHQTWVTYRF